MKQSSKGVPAGCNVMIAISGACSPMDARLSRKRRGCVLTWAEFVEVTTMCRHNVYETIQHDDRRRLKDEDIFMFGRSKESRNSQHEQ